MKKLFPIILLLSCVGAQAEESVNAEYAEVETTVTTTVATSTVATTATNLEAFVKEVPGTVHVHDAANGALDLDALQEAGNDAVVFEADETTSAWAVEAGLTVHNFSNNDKEYTMVLFDTDKKDDIVDWLAA